MFVHCLCTRNKGIYLSAKEESQPTIFVDLKAQYETQLSKGIQGKLATFDREKYIANQKEKIIAAKSGMVKWCETKIEATVDWKSIGGKTLQIYTVGTFCAQVANEMLSMCESDKSFKNKITSINTIE